MYSQIEYALNLEAISDLQSLLKCNECNTQEKGINYCNMCKEILSTLVEYSNLINNDHILLKDIRNYILECENWLTLSLRRYGLSRRPTGYFHNKTFDLL